MSKGFSPEMENARARISLKLILTVSILVLALFATTSLVAQNIPGLARSEKAAAVYAASEEVLREVSQLRGLAIKQPVKSGLKSRAEIEQMVLRDMDESTTPEEFEASNKVLIKLGLVPGDFKLREYLVKLLTEQIAGFYEPKSKEFYLADWIPIEEQRPVMAHELMHALQDQHFNLHRFQNLPRGQSDAEMAIHAMIEGEATAVMVNWIYKPQGVDITKLPPLVQALPLLAPENDNKSPVLSRAPAVLRETLLFPYFYGAGFVQEVIKKTNWQRITDSYNEVLPISTEQILHPDKFLAREQPMTVHLANVDKLLGRDWKRLDQDINGEFGCLLVLAEFIDKKLAARAAEGWNGDRYAFYEHPRTGRSILIQLTTWDTELDAREFFRAYADRTIKRYKDAQESVAMTAIRNWHTGEGEAYMELRGKDVLIVEGAEEAQLRQILDPIWNSKKTPGVVLQFSDKK